MKKILKKLFVTLTLICCIFFAIEFLNKSYADYGDFESYDSGGSSSWDSGSSSYDWGDSDHSYSSGGSSYGGNYYYSGGDWIFAITFIIIFIIVFYIYYKKRLKNNEFNNINFMKEDDVLAKIHQKDPNFNKTDFLGWADDFFIKMQYAWSERKIDNLRAYETPDLFEQTLAQVKQYIDNGRINKMERVCVLNSRLIDYYVNGNVENLSITITAKMTDYIIDEKTKKILKGNPNIENTNTYRLIFMRSADNIQNDDKVTTTMNCPNCGAPTEITSSGKCPYCGSIIVTRKYNWTLSRIEKIF